MELLSRLVEQALIACYDHCLIDWLPGDESAPESFEAECEIESNFGLIRHAANADYYVSMCGVFCIVSAHNLQCWHSSQFMSVET